MDPIKHVVLLMLENHSFDEMLGCFQRNYPDLDGIDPEAAPRSNPGPDGKPIAQARKAAYCMPLDPKHEHRNVAKQIADGNTGFVKDFASAYPSSTVKDHSLLMGYYEEGFLPALHALANDFTICDQWFSSLPGPTWPNRFFALSGTSSGRVLMPEGAAQPNLDSIKDQTQDTIFDRLHEKGKSWKIYYYDFPSSLIFANQRKPDNLSHYFDINQFFNKDAPGDESAFPDFAFIEPKYFGIDQNDDHPPHNIIKAEKLVADVYNAIRSNSALWNNTLLVVVFDEHGGFYDHVVPPAAIPPDNKQYEYDFKQYGVRVPALLVSPWVERGVDHTPYDHTSLLKYLIDKWELGPLGARTANANSIQNAIKRTTARDQDYTVAFIRVPFGQMVKDDGAGAEPTTSSGQEALHVLAAYLERELNDGQSIILGNALTLTAKAARLWVDSKSWLAEKILLPLGNALIDSQRKAQSDKVSRTVSVAENLIHPK
ncbi:MAG TPA: alkaline phosphatase family protein [Methylophilaceae bacterium]|jgi:phospholipase C